MNVSSNHVSIIYFSNNTHDQIIMIIYTFRIMSIILATLFKTHDFHYNENNNSSHDKRADLVTLLTSLLPQAAPTHSPPNGRESIPAQSTPSGRGRGRRERDSYFPSGCAWETAAGRQAVIQIEGRALLSHCDNSFPADSLFNRTNTADAPAGIYTTNMISVNL